MTVDVAMVVDSGVDIKKPLHFSLEALSRSLDTRRRVSGYGR